MTSRNHEFASSTGEQGFDKFNVPHIKIELRSLGARAIGLGEDTPTIEVPMHNAANHSTDAHETKPTYWPDFEDNTGSAI